MTTMTRPIEPISPPGPATTPRPKRAPLTLERFLARQETKPGCEYEDGEVIRKPMPTGWHSLIQRLVAVALSHYLTVHPVGDAGSELRCIFGPAGAERAYLPDYAFIRFSERFTGFTNGPLRGAPDLAVEILSPDDRMVKVMRKLRFYLSHGVRLVWLIDPEERTVMVMTDLTVARFLRDGDTLEGGDVLPGFSVPVAELLPSLTHPVQPATAP